MRKYLFATVICFSIVCLPAQEARNYGAATFLNITPDARTLSLGGASTGIPGDAFSIYRNTAAIMPATGKWAVGYSFLPWLSDNTLHTVGGFYKIAPGHGLAGGFRYYTYPEVNAMDIDGNPLSPYSPAEFSADLGYAVSLLSGLAVSATMRYINSDMGDKTANAVAFDIGVMYSPENFDPNSKITWAAGMSLRNVGSKLKYQTAKESIPTLLMAGGTANILLAPKHNLLVVLDAGAGLAPSDATGILAGAGIEYGFMNRFLLRGGYHYGDSDKGANSYAAAGAGLKLYGFRVDFAYIFPDSGAFQDNTFAITAGYFF